MRLGLRLGLILALVGVVPLAGLAFAASGAARSWLLSSSVEFQVQSAQMLASAISRQLSDTERVLRMHVANFELAEASPQAQQAFLISTYRLFPEIDAAFLVDAAGGDIVPPVFQSASDAVQVPGHALVRAQRIAAIRESLPRHAALGQVAWGRPRAQSEDGPAAITGLFVPPWGDQARLGVEVSLSAVASRMRTMAAGEREVVLFTLAGEVLIQAGPLGVVDPDSFRPLLGTVASDLRYRPSGGGEEVLGAMVRVPGQDLVVAMATPARAVDAAARDIRLKTGYIAGVTLLAAMVFGVLLSRSITDPVEALRDAASRMGAGDFASRVQLRRSDELGELARGFNTMAASLQENQEDLARKNTEIETYNLQLKAKNAEIEAFNEELQARVDLRTAQLRATQASLVQSRQLAAVAELSAGLTHELNNPLAGVVGLLQVLRDRAQSASGAEDPLLEAAEREARRCTAIVGRLSRFTQGPAAGENRALQREEVDVHLLLDDVLALLAGAMRERQLTINHEVGVLRVRGEQSALGRALGQFVAAVRTLAPEGATIDVRSQGPNLVVTLEPVRTSHDDWRAAALGFWAARQVFEEHGAIVEEPPEARERGRAARWLVRFPAVAE